MKRNNKLLFIWIIFTILVLNLSCSKDNLSGVPYVPVNYRSNLFADNNLSGLQNTPGVATVDNFGVRGLVIVHEIDGSYAAYDLCSTVEPQKLCRLKIENQYIAIDTCSGGKFSLLGGGQPAESPAKIALRRYNVSVFSGSITVTN